MPTSATIPVRLSNELVDRLDVYAGKLGVSRSAAIRICLAYQLGVIETAHPRELSQMDGRKQRYKGKENEGAGRDVAENPRRAVR